MTGVTTEIRLSSVTQTMQELRGRVSKIYEEMGGFIVTTTRHMGDFRKMITPYARYFYPADDDRSGESFVAEVVEPSRNDLDAAINRAVSIMAGDDVVNNDVSHAIEEVLGLKRSVDMILGLIDEIDIYSENMLIISTKYGDDGKALARISSEMGSMARAVNGIGVRFRDYLGKLEASREEFNAVRDRIDVIGENYLTTMKLNISVKFNDMINELVNISDQVNGILSSSDELEATMKNFVNNIQMEDVIRQKIEKILYYLDGIDAEADAEQDGPSENFGPAVMHVVAEQLSDLVRDISRQHEEIHGCCESLTVLLGDIQARINLDGDAAGEKDRNRMDAVYSRIEKLKNEYIDYMEEIIASKKKLLGLSASIIDVLNEFEKLFGGIADFIRKFDALNMVTRIELARHTVLSRKLGGALTSVMTLPEKMKRVVDESVCLYQIIRKNMEAAVGNYSGNFRLQEEVLAGCIGSMKKVSVKLYESQKYYRDISNEVGRSCRKVLAFNNENCNNIGLYEAGETLRDIMAVVHAYTEIEYGGSEIDVTAERRRLKQSAMRPGSHSLLAELYRDLGAEKTKDSVILF
ncbi:MAG: hypothetical protein JXA07_04220 [Spirochaetes bacterium]|nr:hypothetical protein [Spirochaetota bacterium]